ncbi:MAG: hypothetical protein U0637_00990 [Phycisphaerales bacterium]
MLSRVVVVMTGPTLSKKSVIANYLHLRLRVGLIESAFLGPYARRNVPDDALRDARRRRLTALARVYVKDELPVIVDSAFGTRKSRREFVSAMSKTNSTVNYLFVCCYSADSVLREIRRSDRERRDDAREVQSLTRAESDRLLLSYEDPRNDGRALAGAVSALVVVDTDSNFVSVSRPARTTALTSLAFDVAGELQRGFARGNI